MAHTISIAGRIGKVDELRLLQDGTAVVNFSVASREGKKKDGTEITAWFDCSCWGKYAEAVAPHLSKGMAVSVFGTVSARAYQGQNGIGASLQVRVEKMDMQSKSDDDGQRQSGGYGQQSGGQSDAWHAKGGGREYIPDDLDEVPF